MMLDPAIPDRSTKDLLEIIETPENWQPGVVVLAKKELIQRGISSDVQEQKRKRQSNFRSKIEAIKLRSSYTKIEKLLIVLFGPILVLILTDLFLFHVGEGYKKKNQQGVFFLLPGFVVWIIILSIIFN